MKEVFFILCYGVATLALLLIGFILICVLISGILKLVALIIDFVLDLRDIIKDEIGE